ncbi:putative beta-glucosidase btgE [Ceratocystis platani]|uniref:Probable beta-glucosidase btgE n=1 Tax=Ceratocystis fimbriata f. sp. platani TaxID=88771 RepID=A0A0F8CZS5_CERFI|nr:putative beta-glucosidase btgE [Ceratocystis platani]
MRAAVIATAFAGIASAGHAHRRAHEALRAERRGGDYGLYPTAAAAADEECVCKTVYGTMYGEPMIYIPDQTTVETSSTAVPSYSEASSTTTTTTTTSSSVSVPPAPPAPVAPTTSSTSLYTPPAAPVAPHTSSAVPSAPAPAPEAPKVTEAKVSSNVPVAPAAVPSSNPPAAKVTKTAVASVVPSQPAAPKSSSPSSSVPGALFPGQQTDHWAITYTPYTDDTGSCKTKEAVDADIKDIKSMGFTTIRVYSTDCDTLPNVGAACEKYGIRMIIGVFIKEAGCAYTGEVQEQVEGIIAWGKFNIVDMLVIGNEAVFSGLCSAAQLTTLITTVKGTCSGAGYTGPYSTAETVNVWEANGSLLCDVIDVAGAQTHPYFNAETTPSKAGSFVKGQIDIVKGICGKPAISLECGWPTKGTCNGAACPGVSEQTQAMASVRETCGEEVVFFTYGEAHWKNPGSCNCEPWFNIKGIFA